jgi:hypothetical protein
MNEELRNEIYQIKNELAKIKKSQQVIKIIKAIQDLKCDISPHFSSTEKIDDLSTLSSKKYVLLEILENMNIDVKIKINKLARHEDFVEQIISFLKKTQKKPTDEDYLHARECFEFI